MRRKLVFCGMGGLLLIAVLIATFVSRSRPVHVFADSAPLHVAATPSEYGSLAPQNDTKDESEEAFDSKYVGSDDKIDVPATLVFLDGEIRKAETDMETCRTSESKLKRCANRLARLRALRAKMHR